MLNLVEGKFENENQVLSNIEIKSNLIPRAIMPEASLEHTNALYLACPSTTIFEYNISIIKVYLL